LQAAPLPHDPNWPRASAWFGHGDLAAPAACDVALLGVPAFATSITPTNAQATPAAVRSALSRYSTWAASRRVDVSVLTALDYGDVADPDGAEGEARVTDAVATLRESARFLVVVGGDNSLTYSVMTGLFPDPEECGLITVDAHHDLRDGVSNGSPVRRLVGGGLPGEAVVQIGIADFANSAAYAERARQWGITVVPRAALRDADLTAVAARALEVAGQGGRPVFVDFDVDVCDRAEAPGCPSAAPGGISADELRQFAFALASDPRVRGIDITEIDATIDMTDQRTVRLAALLILEAAAGLASRER
jgi:formiminoglutamase